MSVPKLRFPEFRDAGEWEVKALSELSTRITEKVGTDKLPTVSISAGFGFVLQSDKFGRDISGEQYKNYIVLKAGEFAYNKGNSKRYPQGCIYKLVEFERVAAPNAFISFRLNEKYVPDFYKQYFEINYHGEQLKKFISSGARSDGLLNINPNDFFTIKFPSPDKPEQQKIADCLSSLDELIAAHNQKLTVLKLHKKGLMQQLFPAEGETVPRLRFPEFRNAGEWEKMALSDIASFASGGTPSKDNPDYWGGNIPWISASSMHEYKIEKSDLNITEVAIADGARIATKGAILILVRGSMLYKRIPLGIAEKDVAFNQDVKALTIEIKVRSDFLLFQLVAKESILLSMVGDTGIGAGKLETDDLKKLAVLIPTLPEQLKIADCLSSLDELIAAQAQKIEALKMHKKALMQQLFPAADEVQG